MSHRLAGILGLLAIALLLIGAVFLAALPAPNAGPALLVAGCGVGAWAVLGVPVLRHLAFTFSVAAFFAAGLFFPAVFGTIRGFDQERLITPLIQIIMFGMGATLSWRDFARALAMPKAVLAGLALQFTVMPLLGWTLATTSGLPPEVAAGVVLIGCCPGGVASNVMTYLAKGNVALSVTMTACSTLLAPVLTPLGMRLLAGAFIEVAVAPMMLAVLNIVILPIAAGLLLRYLLDSGWSERIWRGVCCGTGLALLATAQADGARAGFWATLGAAFGVMASVRAAWLERGLPLVSMGGICYIIAIIAAHSGGLILESGVVLVLVALAHNGLGYLFGYFGARLLGLDEASRRTVAIEVGMQNGGMGAALAVNTLKSSGTAVAPVLFGACMNVTGSILAGFWKDKPVRSPSPPAPEPL